MPLALIIDSADKVPEALRSEYTEKDGKFHLNVEGLEDTTGLKKSLQSEREAAKALKAEIAGWKKLGKSPEEIGELVTAKEAEALEAAKKAGKFDEILAQHQTKWAKERADAEAKLTTERDAALTSERSAVVETKVTTALTSAKATKEGMDLLIERLGRRVKFEIGADGKRTTQIYDADGANLMVGSGPGGLATFEDLITSAKKQYPSLFEGTGAGGTGSDPRGGRRDAGAKTMTRVEFEALPLRDRGARMKQGWTVVD